MHTVVCIVCGKRFETRTWNKRCCSKRCSEKSSIRWRRKYYAIHHKSIEFAPIKCAHCGKEFVPRAVTNKFCSVSCCIKHNTELHKKPTRTKVCPVCGKEFEPRRGTNQIYCCKTCRLKERVRHEMELYHATHKPIGKRKCVVCGKEFTAKNKRHVCCCRRCGKKWYLQRTYKRKFGRIGDKRVCEHCGREFVTKANSQQFCSECKPIVYAEKRRKSNLRASRKSNLAVKKGREDLKNNILSKEAMLAINATKCQNDWRARHPEYAVELNKRRLREGREDFLNGRDTVRARFFIRQRTQSRKRQNERRKKGIQDLHNNVMSEEALMVLRNYERTRNWQRNNPEKYKESKRKAREKQELREANRNVAAMWAGAGVVKN